ncbi:hypothetical protein C1645_830345 [Glomus cerebriforme]|uniref:Uncharacterized protein n=1 Tax=Glomus cerebriforme TaxID=658196 RepID=A0A397SHT9_9GLOM|nr:hypothetical protein C1645_830345 [Glomus cerebriforme]
MCAGSFNNIIIIDRPRFTETIENTTYCQRVRYHFDDYVVNNNYLKYNMHRHNFSFIFSPNNNSNVNINTSDNFNFPYNLLSTLNNSLFIHFESFQFQKTSNSGTELIDESGSQQNEIQFVVYLRSNPGFIRIEIIEPFGYIDVISNLGGFYGSIMGKEKREILQSDTFHLGIPLVEKVIERPEGSSIDDRVQILETLLKEYF